MPIASSAEYFQVTLNVLPTVTDELDKAIEAFADAAYAAGAKREIPNKAIKISDTAFFINIPCLSKRVFISVLSYMF